MATKPKLEIKNLAVRYNTKESSTLALTGVDLTVEDGEFVAVVGPSGCGKSTLLKVVSNLIKPAEGSVLIDGEPVKKIPDGVGMVFQNDALLPWKSVLDNVRLPLAVKNQSKEIQEETARKYIEMVGLAGFEDFYPKQLSGGMKKRVALARAFTYDPSLYLMDEPFGPLDAQTRVIIGEEFLKMWEKVGKSVLFITHDIEEAIALADKVVVMSNRPGRIKAEFKVDIERPRPFYETRFNPTFQRLQKEIWQALAEANKEVGSQL
ncbi:ABC transporter ATP-binding protein [Halalkalibacter oceani]|uniref:ABC transporter ATP-binding protein n=1 Tax=Halalkalibacter oceani TaxID=1653776 RepID=A0A9X2IMT8_9BACI|nr:ABC transporter ATP-binding protein [Halalkalibacter oceani]MCM3714244.1 ABC transporter ATP-binding protein [Halalkalibacter oceani]